MVVALRRQEANPSVHVTVEDGGVGRYGAELEAAAYFACLEALNNAAKHAAGANVSVRLSEEDGHLVFSVRDDGSSTWTFTVDGDRQNLSDVGLVLTYQARVA